MTVYERFFSIGPVLLLVGLSLLGLGLALWKNRPVLISPSTLAGWLSLVFLPVVVVGVYRSLAEAARSNAVVSSLGSVALTALMPIALCVPFVLAVSWFFWLFNVTKDVLLAALGETLQKHGIEYSLHRRKEGLFRIAGISQVLVNLPKLGSTIEVVLASQGRAWLLFTGRRRIHDFRSLVADFRCALGRQECSNSRYFSIPAALLGAAAIGEFVWMALDTFLL